MLLYLLFVSRFDFVQISLLYRRYSSVYKLILYTEIYIAFSNLNKL